MTRLAGFVLAAVGGYLIVRHRVELRSAVVQLKQRRAAAEARALRGWDDETEYQHAYEREAAHRHELAEEIRRHPLRERPADDSEGIASQPIRRERDDHPYPTSY